MNLGEEREEGRKAGRREGKGGMSSSSSALLVADLSLLWLAPFAPSASMRWIGESVHP